MVGLSVVLEKNQKSVSGNIISKKTPQFISKTSMSINQVFLFSSSSSADQFNDPASTFLEQCYLCKQKLLPGKDIYMYKGDKGFCSEECRYRQIFMDDQEENLKKENCCLASMKMKMKSSTSSPSGAAAAASSSSGHHRKAY